MANKQTLKDFLHLNEIKRLDKLLYLEGIVSNHYLLIHKFKNINPSDLWYIIDNFNMNSVLEKNIFSDEVDFRKRINESKKEETIEVYKTLTEMAREREREKYYIGIINAYYYMMKECEELSARVAVYNQKVKPILENSEDSVINKSELRRILSKEDFDELDDKINHETTLEDIEKVNKEFHEKDKARDDFHKFVLGYAKKEMRRDYLDVILDILGKEDLVPFDSLTGSNIKPYLINNRTSLVINLGIKELRSAFGIEYTLFEENGKKMVHTPYRDGPLDEYLDVKKQIKKDYKELKEAEKGKSEWREKPVYKSEIVGHKEEDDIKIIKKTKKKFPKYVGLVERICTHFHGEIMFLKSLEINIAKIREENKNPDAIVYQIVEYAKSLINKK